MLILLECLHDKRALVERILGNRFSEFVAPPTALLYTKISPVLLDFKTKLINKNEYYKYMVINFLF